jgi:hypothetical protein
MAQQALGPGSAVPRRRALFGLLDGNGWAWASVKAFAWLIIIIFLLGYLPDRAYYLTVGRTVDLLPVAVLRQRGVLESTVRHEVAHVVVDPSVAGRPVWVREGLALYFSSAGGAAPVPDGRPACPSDAELLRAVSAGALREAYSRAERCVRRQIAAGTRWTDVR